MLLILSGSNRRYKYINNMLLDNYPNARIIVQEDFKGDYIGKYSRDLSYDVNTIELFENHMQVRDLTEERYFPDDRFHFQQSTESIYVTAKELNSDKIVEFIYDHKPSVVFVFGVGVLKSKILECLNGLPVINLHFGLSPYFRGSDTLLWPLYLQNPGCIGITLHQIDSKIDHGPIYHQQYTDFDQSDSIHDLFCKTVLQGGEPTLTLIDLLINGIELEPIPTRQVGKMFYSGEFSPHHLKVVYDLIDAGMLVKYLDNREHYGQPAISSVLDHRFGNYR